MVELIESTLSSSMPQLAAQGWLLGQFFQDIIFSVKNMANFLPFLHVAGDIEGKHKNFISGKFQELAAELTF